MIHWFTRNTQYESPDTITLLDAILDGVVDPSDTSLRDFCGQCVREFLAWSIKQTSKKVKSKMYSQTFPCSGTICCLQVYIQCTCKNPSSGVFGRITYVVLLCMYLEVYYLSCIYLCLLLSPWVKKLCMYMYWASMLRHII